MSEKNGAQQNGAQSKPDLAALRAEIVQARAELGETVQALVAKVDVKARAKEQVEQTRAKVRAQAIEATEWMREAAQLASGKVRDATVQATDKARGTAAQATDKVKESGALDRAEVARQQVRNNPIPLAAVLAGLAAVVGVILIVRGRRR
ncbi:MAG TPA: DUF3618 domain-containing protein [Actinoplanes sp.]|nr:DUF3618 domain-containing protein [Actinoplanes sp.]